MSPKIVLYNKLASVFLQNITTCRFVVESPLNPQEAVAFRSSASYSHRGSLVVHEVSFPGNTFKLASTCSIVSGDVVARQKTEANDASARFFYKEACLCKRSKTPSTEKHRPYRKNSHLTQRQYVALLPHKQQNTTGYGSVKNKNNTSV